MKEKVAELKALVKSLYQAGGCQMRYALLAYALVRGMPYYRLEYTLGPHTGVSRSRLEELTGFSHETVEEWLCVPADPVFVEHVRRSQEQYRQRKDERRALRQAG